MILGPVRVVGAGVVVMMYVGEVILCDLFCLVLCRQYVTRQYPPVTHKNINT